MNNKMPVIKVSYWAIPGLRRDASIIVDKVFREVSKESKIDEDLLRSAKRGGTFYLSDTKHICMYIMHRHLGMTYTEVGKLWNMDHTSVRYGIQKIAGWCEDGMQPEFRDRVNKIVSKL